MSELTCAFCGTPTVPGARYCHYCGVPLERPGIDGETERRLVTVLFGDLSDFTGWAEDLDPERVGIVTDRVLAALSRVVADLGGHVDKLTGDGIMAVFGAPVARTDDAERAVRASLLMQRQVRRLVADEAGGGRRLGLRVGLNTGEVLAGIQAALSYTVVGDTVNTAARLSDAASVGTVYAGHQTMLATAHIAEWRELAPLRLKGKREPVVAYELERLRPVPVVRPGVRDRAPLVGRQAEYDALRARFDQVAATGNPAVVAVTGDVGVGKTRLVQEMAGHVEDEGGRVLWGRCTGFAEGGDLEPLHDWVRAAAGVADDEVPSEDELADRVRRLAQRLDPVTGWGSGAGVLADGLLALLGHVAAAVPTAPTAAPGAEPDDPAQTALTLLITTLARAPLLLVVDDLHNAPRALVAMLERLVPRLAGPVLLVLVERTDEALGLDPVWRTPGLRVDQAVDLAPLDDTAAEQLAGALLGSQLPPAARAALVDRAEGNPQFLGELIALLLDRGVLRRSDGGWEVDEVGITRALPAGVRAAISARIDALDGVARAVLRDAAVVGVRCPVAALRALGHDDEELIEAIAVLGDRALLDPVGQPPADAVHFRHAVVRDVAYAGLPKAERARLHAAVAEWAARAMVAAPAEVDSFVGAHAERAVQLAREMSLRPVEVEQRVVPLGVRALGRLGTDAAERGEFEAVAALLGRALDVAGAPSAGDSPAHGALREELRRLRVTRAGALAHIGQFAQARRDLGDSPSAADPTLAAPALLVRGQLRQAQHDLEGAEQSYLAALRTAGDVGDDRVAGEALRSLGLLDYAAGRLSAAERRFDEALDLAQRAGDIRASGWALEHLTWSATTRGDYRAAESTLRRAADVFASLDDPSGLSWCTATEAYLRALQGRYRAARAITGSLLESGEPIDRWARAMSGTVDAIAAAELGLISAAAESAERAGAEFRVIGDAWGELLSVIASGFAARGSGDLDEAVAILGHAWQSARQSEFPVLELLATTTVGYCHLDRGDLDAAELAARHAQSTTATLELERHAYVGVRVLLGQVVRRRGDLDAAITILGEAASVTDATLLFPRRQALAHYAGTLLEAGRVDDAAVAIRAAFAVPAEDVRSHVIALRVRASVLRAQGQPAAARVAIGDALRVMRATELRGELAATERALAEL